MQNNARGISVLVLLLLAALACSEARTYKSDKRVQKRNGTTLSRPKKTKTGAYLTCDFGCLPDMWCDSTNLCQYSLCGGGFSCPVERPVCGGDSICRIGAGGAGVPGGCGYCSPGSNCVNGRCVAGDGGLASGSGCALGCSPEQSCRNGVCVGFTCANGGFCPFERPDLTCNVATGRCVLKSSGIPTFRNPIPSNPTFPTIPDNGGFSTCAMGCAPEQSCQGGRCVTFTCQSGAICPFERPDLTCNVGTGRCVLKSSGIPNPVPANPTFPTTPCDGGFSTCAGGCQPEETCHGGMCVLKWSTTPNPVPAKPTFPSTPDNGGFSTCANGCAPGQSCQGGLCV